MLKRLLSTLVLWGIVIILPLTFGIHGAIWLLALFTFFTQLELYNLISKIGFRPQSRLGCFLGFIMIIGTWYAPQLPFIHGRDAGSDIFTLSIIIISLTVLKRPDFSEAKANIMPTLLGLLLVPFMLSFYVRIIYYFHTVGFSMTGMLLTLWLIAVAKFSDVGGLLVGMGFGKHKLAPAISPGKTWEGALGGVIVACVVGSFLCSVFHRFALMPFNFTPLVATIVAIPVSILAIASDLIESVLKRQAGVKDSGKIIPGIGGAFDLTDSLLLSASSGFLIFKYMFF